MKVSNNDLANVLRILSIDMIDNAKSGHPGAPMGMADIAEILWRKYINHNPNNPKWINRDRFILSNGHSSALLYSILHLSGYKISIDDLKNFRKINSITPGHPEYNPNLGIEISTGPLGQGLANAVGFAIAEKLLSNKFNTKEFNIINHYTYVFVGDGCLMEGISHEACSLAGTLNLNKLIVFYDSNNISIDGKIDKWFSDDTKKRFLSYNWNVINNINGHNRLDIKRAINKSIKSNKPSLIICKTIIGYGSPNTSGSNLSHGTPLGIEENINVRGFLNWKYDPFIIPKEIYNKWNAKKIGEIKENKWINILDLYKKKFPDLYNELNRRMNSIIPKILEKEIDIYINKLKNDTSIISTRKSSQNVLECIGNILPELIGGSADLTSSNLTNWSKSISVNEDFNNGNYIHYGVREFGMTAISNGISCYGGFIVYCGTFLVFMDYAKNAIRMASLMKIKHILIYTHDSIGVGEDGPTHQPIEHLNDLRIIPNLDVWRPCDELETLISWKNSIYANNPSAIILSRQNLININRNNEQINNINKGGYVLCDCLGYPEIIIISTGSEIKLSINIQKKLFKKGYKVRLVSMPSTNIFDNQDKLYKQSILLEKSFKVSIEASHSDFWYKYIKNNGIIIGIDDFGKSGSEKKLFEYFEFTEEKIINKIINNFCKK